jgi:glycine/D-amino acid oxidase-like deaminating enzyme
MWADYYLRPNGQVVVVGADEEHPDVDTVHADWSNILRMLVWGAERYPELRELLPARGPGAIDCPTCQAIPLFGEGKVLCPTCGGLHWLPPTTPGLHHPETGPFDASP